MPEKILVVEDEITLQETLAYNLERQGMDTPIIMLTTREIFMNPKDQRTEDDITGRCG